MAKFIPLTKPQILNTDVKLGYEALKKGWNTNHDFYIKKFENNFKKKIGCKYAVATSSCTGAITLALASLNIRKGSEVIISNLNWVATVSPIVQLGLKPIFCDIELKNWCIDPNKMENLINKNTGAIIVTHLYGNLCDMKKIMKIAEKKKLPVIEDAAEALGSKYRNKYAGAMGDIGCFSFHATKSLVTGEGGMLTTNKKNIYEKVRKLNNHGRSKSNHDFYLSNELGYKFKITNFQAALGISQLRRLEKIILKKRKIFEYYQKNLKMFNFKFNHQEDNEYNSYWLTSISVDKKYNFSFTKFRNYMKKKKS